MSLSREKSPLKFYKQRKASGLGLPRKPEDKAKWVNGCLEYIATNMVSDAVTETICSFVLTKKAGIEAVKVVFYKQYYKDLKQRCIEYEKKEKEHKEPDEDTVERNHRLWIFKKAEERVERLKRELENAEDILSKAREAKEALE